MSTSSNVEDTLSSYTISSHLAWRLLGVALVLFFAYLYQLNRILSGTPEAVEKLSPTRWTKEEIKETYNRLVTEPITVKSCKDKLPPRLDRRYIVTGGSGLVGGYVVLQLLARGQSPESIRIVDFRSPDRSDMLTGPATDVDFAQADISLASSTMAAFAKPWPISVAHLPITVLHTASVIVPSERSPRFYAFCEAVNVNGTRHVADAARAAGADILVFTSSASISIRRVQTWISPLRMLRSLITGAPCWPRDYFQVLDVADFARPLRRHDDYYANYAVSKAAAERIVCAANGPQLRTGCVRPAHGIYGMPTDNTIGWRLKVQKYQEWTDHIVESFMHGLNAAVSLLDFEAVLAHPKSHTFPQAGRPFVVTDPNPPIAYQDVHFLLQELAETPCRAVPVPPVPILLLAYVFEWYMILLARFPVLQALGLPAPSGDIKHLTPALFSIATHLVASNDSASRSVEDGGLGYKGLLTTLEGMALEALDWNVEQSDSTKFKTEYKTSVLLGEEMQQRFKALKQ